MKAIITLFIFMICQVQCLSQTTVDEANKIAVFCKLWGFLKYYHPTVAKGQPDWDREFTSRYQVVTSLHSKTAINQYYSEWIYSLGEVISCNIIPASYRYMANFI